MTNVFTAGIALLKSTLQANAGVAVTYHRGPRHVALTAWLGSTGYEQLGSDGSLLERVESLDFLIPAADLIISGELRLPARGDTIKVVRGTQTHVYELMGTGPEPIYRYSDHEKTILRIHTKLISVLND